MQALHIYGGPEAQRILRERGLRAEDVRVVPAAAGGPKGIMLLAMDQLVFGSFLAGAGPAVHLLGSSIGAWRMACACKSDPAAALAELAEDYLTQRYTAPLGRLPTPEVVSREFGAKLAQRVSAFAPQVLAHPRYRLHVVASRGRGLLHHLGKDQTTAGAASKGRAAAGFAAAFVANALSRRALGAVFERVWFSDPRMPLPQPLLGHGIRTRTVELNRGNLEPAILASCTIPFAMLPVHDVPGAPEGSYWDGGLTDYHLHLNYATLGQGAGDAGIALYPHFQPQVVPGWLDKSLKRRHHATPALSRLVVLCPNPQWVATLPGGKLPDRSDFTRFLGRDDEREALWRGAYRESFRLADELAQFIERSRAGQGIQAQPLP